MAALESLGASLRTVELPQRIRDRGLLPHRDGRGELELRDTTACATEPVSGRWNACRALRRNAQPWIRRRVSGRCWARTRLSAEGDAYYLKAQQVRTLIRRDFDRAFGASHAIAPAK